MKIVHTSAPIGIAVRSQQSFENVAQSTHPVDSGKLHFRITIDVMSAMLIPTRGEASSPGMFSSWSGACLPLRWT